MYTYLSTSFHETLDLRLNRHYQDVSYLASFQWQRFNGVFASLRIQIYAEITFANSVLCAKKNNTFYLIKVDASSR
jgi:hypothetical protein